MPETLTTGDVLAIQNLIARYALHADEGDFEAVGALLADADFYAQGVLIAAKDGALVTQRFIAAPRPEGAARRHVTTNVIVDALGPDLAKATSYYIWLETVPGQAPRMLQCGIYRDRFERTSTGWRFIERNAVGDGIAPAKSA